MNPQTHEFDPRLTQCAGPFALLETPSTRADKKALE